MPPLDRICDHEISHGVVALDLGFDKFSRVFVDCVTPAITRRGGIDANVEGLRERFDTKFPVDDRRTLAVKIIAIYAAGAEGERLVHGEADANWSGWDEEQIAWFGLGGVYEDEDLPLLNQNPGRDNGWDKWDRVDAVIAEGRRPAADILRRRVGGLRKASNALLQMVTSSGGKSYLTREQLARIIRKS